MILQSMAIEMPRCDSHPNRAPFGGVLTLVDVPSDKPPAGARGHRVLMTRAAAERALPSLLGMALDYTPSLDRHDARRKVGIITSADIVPGSGLRACSDGSLTRQGTDRRSVPAPAWARQGFNSAAIASALVVEGYIFARDFPEIIREMRAEGGALGMSYEIAEARVADVRAAIWTLTDFAFTGAAVLRRDKAAYRETWIELIG